jgi:hypothetical protein
MNSTQLPQVAAPEIAVALAICAQLNKAAVFRFQIWEYKLAEHQQHVLESCFGE